MKKVVFWTVALLLVMGSINPGICADDGEGEKVYAIQDRIYHRNHELSVSGGYIPNEDFHEAYPVGLGYTFNFNEYFSWEVARGQYIFTSEKELKKDIEQSAEQLTPSLYAEPKYMVHSHLVFRPFYGKAAVVNRGIINRETYIFAGGGMVNYEWQNPEGSSDSEMVNSISFGLGTKYFINENLCMNLEIRDLVNMWDGDTDNRIYFGIGFGFRFNLLARKAERNSDVERMNEYLKKSTKDE